MTSPSQPIMSCADFEAQLPDFLEEHTLSATDRTAAELHLASCAECTSLVAELRDITRRARALAPLTPSRDLWAGIESRIEAPVVALPTSSGFTAAVDPVDPTPLSVTSQPVAVVPSTPHRQFTSWQRLAVAASLLVTVTAAATYTIVARNAGLTVSAPLVQALESPSLDSRLLHRASTTETFDREIAALRKLVDARRSELDPITVGIVEKNLKLIDQAIAESKAALAADPANAFLSDRLTHAYDTKLQLLREIATRAPRS